MTLARFTAWTLLVGAGFALFARPAAAQDTPPKKDSTAFSEVGRYRDIPRGSIPADEMKAAKENFAKVAKYVADVVSYPPMYRSPQEFKVEKSDNPYTIDGPNGVLYELNRLLLEPVPGAPRKLNSDQAVYIQELGAALDAALKPLITGHPETIVKVNAARVLAHVCRGGAPVHYATLTPMIANANTRPEIKLYLFHAAANLLAAYDVNWIKTRNHVGQTDDPKPLGALVKALDDCVTNPALLLPGLPGNRADKADPDQLAVVGLVRRQAIKALAKVRYVAVYGPDGTSLMYPAYTLARVAMSDPNLLPAPGPADTADAILGLVNMAPVQAKGDRTLPVKYNADAAVEAITAGLLTFAKPRAANAFDRSLPWRSYSLDLALGLRNWRLLFDPDFDYLAPNKTDMTRIPAVVDEFYKDVVPKVLAPMDKVGPDGKPDIGATVAIETLQNRLNGMRNNPKRAPLLFPEVARTTIDFPPPATPAPEKPPEKTPEKK